MDETPDRSNDPRRRSRVAPIAVVLALATLACDGNNGSGPTAPLAPAPTESAIALASIAPASGSTLRVDACFDSDPQGLCTEDLRVTFSVLPERDLAQAKISVTFYEGDLRGRQCALATSETLDLGEGRRVSMTVSRVDMIIGGDGGPRGAACEMPATTHLMRATLVQDPNQQSHSEDFGSVYTFARP